MQGDVLRVFYLDVENQRCNVIKVKDDLNVLYNKLNCSCIDIVKVTIQGREFDVVCDDEVLFNSEVKPAILSRSNGNQAIIFGNVLLFSVADAQGDLVELDAEGMVIIMQSLATAQFQDGEKYRVIIAD